MRVDTCNYEFHIYFNIFKYLSYILYKERVFGPEATKIVQVMRALKIVTVFYFFNKKVPYFLYIWRSILFLTDYYTKINNINKSFDIY